MPSVKFIHAADIHLDSPLRGLSAYPDAPAERLRTATRDALENLVSFTIEEQADFLVIAGDLYDGNWRDFNTGLFFIRQMGRLRAAGIPVYLLWGNHDAESEMTRTLQLPDNVHVFASRAAQTLRIEHLQVALHGHSFKVAATTDDLVPGYPAPVPGWLNIGVLHTALEGNAQHASYAPCSLAQLRAKGYQYWALGHVHTHWLERGDVTIAYPGNLQGRHIRETGAHGALRVTAQGGEITAVERVELDVLRWHLLQVDISAAADLPTALRLVGNALEQLLRAASPEMTLAVRVVLTGSSAAHQALIAHERQLRQEVIALAVALAPERLWLEKVQLATTALAESGTPDDAPTLDALLQLAELAEQAPADEAFAQALRGDWAQVLDKLPHDLLSAAPELQALQREPDAQLADYTQAANALLQARLGSSTATTAAED